MATQPATPLSTLTPVGSLYPFALEFRVATNDSTSVDFWNIPRGTIITMMLAKVRVAGIGSASSIVIGDDDEEDGYILSAVACGATVDAVYGDVVAERGIYLNNNVDGAYTYHGGSWKVYDEAGKELKLKGSGTLSTEAIFDVFVFGYRFSESTQEP